jgi:hypothetical protein
MPATRNDLIQQEDFTTMIQRTLACCISIVLLSTSFLWAQQPAAPAAPQSDTSALEQRMKEMEERIISLEGQVRQLKAQNAGQAANAPASAIANPVGTGVPPVAAPEPATQATAQIPGPQTEGQGPNLGGATGMAKALNPDISVIGDFLGSAGINNVRPVPSLEMHESEVGFQAIIDPYARGDFFLSFGEEGVNLEEGYITFTALPAGFVARAGKMRAAFGKVNTLHNHVLPWTDRPMVTDNLVGGEDGIDDAGFSVTRAFAGPKGTFLEGTAQIFRGDSGDLFRATRKNNVSTVAHFRGYRDITESTNVDIGVSYARGHNGQDDPNVSAFGVTNLYGVDTTFRWKPLRRSIYHSFVGRGEFIWSQRQQPLTVPVDFAPGFQRAFGFYTSGDYQLGRRWFVGGRFDRSDRSHDARITDTGASAVLTYWPSEFAQLRAQYRHANYGAPVNFPAGFNSLFNANELRFQVQFSLGAHGAHPF